MRTLPPVARLALAFACGAVLAQLSGSRLALAPLLVLPLLPPIGASRGPRARVVLVVALGAGLLAGRVHGTSCELGTEPGTEAVLEGHFLAVGAGGGGRLLTRAGACRKAEVRVFASAHVEVGVPVRVRGRWRGGRRPTLAADTMAVAGPPSRAPRWALARWRARLLDRIERLYGERGPMVGALVLASREGLDPELREAFARSGTVHLLAISGFHVGVVSGALVALLRSLGMGRRRAGAAGAAGTGLYVALLGFPDAASRAALILGALASSRLLGRPPARWGALGTALLVLLALEPARIGEPGFQLSFAGAAGLTAWKRPIERALEGIAGGGIPRPLASSTAAGAAATVATLPIVAWHFERVSLVGIPATLLASPLVALALPGALASVVVDLAHGGMGRFVGAGPDAVLAVLEAGTRWLGRPGWVSVWIPRTWVPVGLAGAAGGLLAVRGAAVRTRVRWASTAAVAVSAVAAWPLLLAVEARSTVEVAVFDVGQGDAIGIRTPRGRWVLVDAGPPFRGEPGRHPAVRGLRRMGAGRLELLVLTHPDLDHVGGAAAVLSGLEVGAVLDPGWAAGQPGYVAALAAAQDQEVPWGVVRAGRRLNLDGVRLRVLHPAGGDAGSLAELEPNERSVVLLLSYGSFDVLLSGDAPAGVERRIAPDLDGPVEVLKVAHHGSRTSTDPVLLERASPAVALISVGRGNRYGHPAPVVLDRLGEAGVDVYRTDRRGTLRVRGRADGTFRVLADGGAGR